MLAVRYATRELKRSDCFFRYHTYDEPDGPVRMDFFFWVLRDDDSVTLVDTGAHPEAIARRPGIELLVPPVDALRQLGIDPASVSRVVATHFHFDHIGNVSSFPNARITFQRKELEFWAGAYGEMPPQAFSAEREEIAYLGRALEEGRVDLLDGDAQASPGVRVHLVGGHCPGQVLTVVDGDPPIVLASDAMHLYEEMERDMPFSLFSDLEGLYDAYAELRRMEALGHRVVAGHDPLVLERFETVRHGDTSAARIG